MKTTKPRNMSDAMYSTLKLTDRVIRKWISI